MGLAASANACVPTSEVSLDLYKIVEADRLKNSGLKSSRLGKTHADKIKQKMFCAEDAIEDAIMGVPAPEMAHKWLKHYASTEHMAGTAGDLEMAQFTRDMMREFGLEHTEIVPMDALLSYPVERGIEVVSTSDGSDRWSPKLEEAILEEDPTSGSKFRNLTFLAYAATGEAKGELVYANYGRPEDFEVLVSKGINLSGKIALVRYGECFRGLKIMNAQAYNASAVLIYSDPEDDGYGKGQVYPNGPWRPASSVQRGSAQFNSLCAGDPARAASGFDSKTRCGFEQNELIPAIPAIPISYEDAIPLLQRLAGPLAPPSFVGALNVTYKLGPSSGWEVRMHVNNTREVKPIWNVISRIPGTLAPAKDQPIILGNHRDAWVFGAADPNSGSAVLMEVARSLGKLVQGGWRPRRTIILGSWSGEEFGLLGSTGWGEAHADGLLSRAAVYINTDVGVSGSQFYASASPSVGRAILDAAKVVVTNTTTGQTLADDWNLHLGTLGSGSDYTVFLDHLGIASMDLRFGPASSPTYGVYHSTFDSYTWIEKEADPTFTHHVSLAKLIGVLLVRFATAPTLPISLTDHGAALEHYVDHLKSIAHEVDFSEMQNAVNTYQVAAKNAPCHDNSLLGFHERLFLDPAGLPHRPWFKHILQAPGLYLGYDAKVLPGIDQAISDKDSGLVEKLIQRYAKLFRRAAEIISSQSNPGEAML